MEYSELVPGSKFSVCELALLCFGKTGFPFLSIKLSQLDLVTSFSSIFPTVPTVIAMLTIP